jgi:hypothetical protein
MHRQCIRHPKNSLMRVGTYINTGTGTLVPVPSNRVPVCTSVQYESVAYGLELESSRTQFSRALVPHQ